MRPGPHLRRPVPILVLALVLPALGGCGLLSGGSEVEESFEYLPADATQVRFAEGGLDEEIDVSELAAYAKILEGAPFDVEDVEWEAAATWGDQGEGGSAAVWKVDDDLDFDALADDLEEKGYAKASVKGRSLFTIDLADSQDGLVGDTYPVPLLLNVLLDEDEQVVAGGSDPGDLEEIAAVIADDEDSLADDAGFEDLLDAAEDEPDVAWLARDGDALCEGMVARGLFLLEEKDARLVLQYDDEGAAEDDLDARRELVEEGVDVISGRPFDELGEFDLERDGDRVVVEEDWDGGPQQAFRAEQQRGGPGACTSAPVVEE